MRKTLSLENIQMIYKNFKGEKRQNNKEGDRNFAIFIGDKKFADELAADGWHIKEREERETGDPFWFLPVAVKFGDYPPAIFKIGEETHRKTQLDEDSVEMLDYLVTSRVDVELSPYHWTMPSGSSGVKAYLQTMYVLVPESPIELQWETALANWEPGTPLFGD